MQGVEVHRGYYHLGCGRSDKLTFPLPHRTRVPIKATFFRSEILLVTFFGSTSVDFITGSVSPVKLDSSIANSTAWKSTSPSSINQSTDQSFIKKKKKIQHIHNHDHQEDSSIPAPMPSWSSSHMLTKPLTNKMSSYMLCPIQHCIIYLLSFFCWVHTKYPHREG